MHSYFCTYTAVYVNTVLFYVGPVLCASIAICVFTLLLMCVQYFWCVWCYLCPNILDLFYFKSLKNENHLKQSQESAIGLNTDTYGVALCIQSKCGKIRARKTPNTYTFHGVYSLVKAKIVEVKNVSFLWRGRRLVVYCAAHILSVRFLDIWILAACIKNSLLNWLVFILALGMQGCRTLVKSWLKMSLFIY